MEFTADSAASLQELRSRKVRSRIRRIRLAGPLEDERAERAINRAYFACGCEHGSIAVMAVMVASLSSGVLLGFDGALAWWRILIYLAAAAFIGKMAGLALARVRLRRIYGELVARTDEGQSDRHRQVRMLLDTE
jgi:hypothetical protein